MKHLKYLFLACIILMGCNEGLGTENGFDEELAAYAKTEYHRGCGDFERTRRLLEAYCEGVGHKQSKACAFMWSVD